VTGLLVATLVVTGLGVVVQRLGAPRSSFVTRAASAVIPGPSRIAKAEASDSLWSDAPVAPAAPAAPPTVVPPSPATAPAGPRAGRVDRLSALAANLARTSRGGVRGAAMWPLNGPITGPFLERRGSHRHPGVDISAPIGTPVPAAAPGRVILAGPAPSAYSGYGILVIIDHGNGDISMYAHLSRVSTHVGEAVATGDVIGLVGATGRATGPHLHFEVRRGNAIIDPVKWVAALLGL
jgi:murein DD-endopeptidase MepM/ murein hydrolase activator NlpD